MRYSNEEIIEAILSNKKDVLFFLYDHNFESLLQLIKMEGGSRKDAEDVFHDALLILYLKIKGNNLILTSSIHTFLQAIARNVWKRLLKKKAVDVGVTEVRSEILAEEPQWEEELNKIERRKLYLRHLEDMPQDCKRLIKMVIQGLNLNDITRLMPFNSVEFTKTKRSRCKVMLIKKITNDPLFKELKNERFRISDSLPRW
jgi:DNA-directed RNA polymerase specialized sigma24 family protein